MTDGTSQTILAGEVSWEDGSANGRLYGAVDWALSPTPYASNVGNAQRIGSVRVMANGGSPMNGVLTNTQIFGSMHEGGAQFVFCDGSVRFISENIQTTSLAPANPYFDLSNNGIGYGLYQRLFSRNDGFVTGDF